jgi:parvulin-like peptidyl-prolyl isomerase
MPRHLRYALALGAFFALALTLAACGGGVPSGDVVKVGDTGIKTSTYQHWLQIAAISSQAQTNPATGNQRPKANIPDAPNFTKCIAQKKAATPAPKKGQPLPTDAQFKAQCQQEYDGLKNQVMSFLIRSQWLEGEAQAEGVKVTDKEVRAQLDKARQQAFPKLSDYQKFLLQSGMTEADLLFRQRGQVLEQKITQKITKNTGNVTDAQVQAYYTKNKAQFGTPEQRDLLIVLTKTPAKAQQALAALKSGQSFAKVASKFSIDQASKNNGGKLLNVAKGQQEPAFDSAIFSAPKGKVEGPVKTQFGYYVFEVTKVTKATQQPLSKVKPQIVSILKSQSQQTKLQTFGKSYQKRWRAKTECAKAYVTPDCKNYKAPKAGTTGTTTTG